MYWTKRIGVGWALPFPVVKIIRVQIVAILEILIVCHCVIFLFRNGEIAANALYASKIHPLLLYLKRIKEQPERQGRKGL